MKRKPCFLVGMFLVIAVAAFLAGCVQRGRTVAVVGKNIEEGRLAPKEAVDSKNILNEYSHLLPKPTNELLAVHIFSDQSKILSEGGNTVIQIGLASQAPKTSASQLHFLFYLPDNPDDKTSNEMGNIVSGILKSADALPPNSSITVDTSKKIGLFEPFNSLQPHKDSGKLEKFVRRFLLQSFVGDKHRIILAVAKHGELSKSQQQNLIDMAEVFTANNVTLSVLAFGKKPDFGFLEQMSQRGSGMFHVLTSELEIQQWLQDEVSDMHATMLKEINLKVELGHGIKISKPISGIPRYPINSSIKFSSSDIKLGEQRVFLAEVSLPQRSEKDSVQLAQAGVSYYDAVGNQYLNTQSTLTVGYTDNINQALTQHNPLIQRSLLILKTAETLRQVAEELQNKRVYKGMALLKKQSGSLREMGNRLQDKELLRDARVLDKYAERLFEFPDEYFQNFKIWRDLSWDTDRFQKDLE